MIRWLLLGAVVIPVGALPLVMGNFIRQPKNITRSTPEIGPLDRKK